MIIESIHSRRYNIFYGIATSIMCIVFLFSAGMYLMKYEMVSGFFTQLGFPVWLIYPMAILKILGVVTIVTKLSKFLKELAYSGFLFNAVLALSAHIMSDGSGYLLSVIALISLIVSWILDRRISTNHTSTFH